VDTYTKRKKSAEISEGKLIDGNIGIPPQGLVKGGAAGHSAGKDTSRVKRSKRRKKPKDRIAEANRRKRFINKNRTGNENS